MARSEPRIFDQALARTTPPTSGETITKFSGFFVVKSSSNTGVA